jgi:hypothetical protein
MAAACDFDAIPRSITSAGSVRFFPRVSGFTKPIVTYDWDFGDGTTHSAKPTPIHAYPVVTVPTTYTVTLVVTDSNGGTATLAKTNYIRSDAVANVSAPPNDGTYPAISVLIYDDTTSMLVNRNPWTGCHLYLLYPKTVDSIDKIGTGTFSLLDVGDSSATEKALMAEKKFVVFILGKTIIFSGKIRRITQNTQSGFDTTTRVKLWDVECDSDLAKLQMVNIDSSVLQADGKPLYDTPGNIARKILKETSPARPVIGVINCVDTKVVYQLNSTTVAEQAGNQYDHMMALMAQNNYDLRSRADFLLYNYTGFDGATVITNSAAGWTISEFVGMYAIFVGRDAPVSKTFTTVFATSTSEILVTTASTFFAVNDRVTLSSTGALPTGLTTTTYYVKTVTSDHLTLSTSIGGATVTFSSNGTGTHSLILVAETAGVKTYGKITANTATTITCAAMVGAASAPQSLGYFLIYRGYLIDFAHDLSQPVAIDNLNVNQDVFQFSDNDDKRKLSTKIVATGKDLQGKTISVAVSGVHAWNAEAEFFEESTHVTLLSEGYVYKNSYINAIYSCTAIIPQSGKAVTKTNLSTDTTGITLPASQAGFLVNQEVTFTAPPRPLVAGTVYFVSDHTGDVIKVSATQGGSNITLLENLRNYVAQWSISSDASAAGIITVTIKGTVAVTVAIANGTSSTLSCIMVANALNGYVDNQGCTWAVSGGSGGFNAIDFTTKDAAYAGTEIALNMGTTGQTSMEESESTPAISCTASTPAQMQVDNSKGLFQKGTAIVFKATTMPSGGLTAGTVYTVKNDGVNLSGFCFCVMSGGTQMSWSDTGTAVKVYRSVDVINRNTSGTSSVWLYGSGFSIDTTLTYCLLTPYGTYDNVTLSDTGTVQVASDGTVITQFLLLESTLPASSDSDYGGRGFFMAPRLYVADHTKIGGNYEVLIGEETVTITARNNDTTYGNYIDIGAASARITSASKKCYPHGVGALVARTTDNSANPVDEEHPQVGSPIALYGLYIDSRTVDNNITYGTLDAYATSLLVGLGNFYQKATTWGPLVLAHVQHVGEYYGGLAQQNISIPPRSSDRLNFTEYTGATPDDYQVVAVTIDCDRMTVTLELGDFEKNVFTSLQQSTNAVNRTLT